MKFRTILNNNIKYLIKNQGFSIKRLSDEISVSRASMTNYYHDKALPSIEFLVKFADKFNVSIDDLLTKDLTAGDFVSGTQAEYNRQNNSREIEYLKKEIALKDKMIAQLEKMLAVYDKMFEKFGNDLSKVEQSAKGLLQGKDIKK